MSRATGVTAAMATALATTVIAGCGSDPAGVAASAGPTAAAASPTPSAALTAGPAQTLVETGLDQLDRGEQDAARVSFTSAVSLDPDNVFAHYNLGLIAQRADEREDARSEYDAAITTDPGFVAALYNRAILEEDVDLSAAVEMYRRLTATDPTYAPAFMRMGFALVHLGQTVAGAQALGQGMSLDPSMAEVDSPTYKP